MWYPSLKYADSPHNINYHSQSWLKEGFKPDPKQRKKWRRRRKKLRKNLKQLM